MNGVLILNKPKDFTSFDVVAKLRKILSIKKIGHGGTLDPLATGVLPVFIGKATKIIEMIPDHDKKYIAGFKLGAVTDTQDISGKIISKKESKISFKDMNNILKLFEGEINQTPPMYSAVKINGRRLYEMARKGQEVNREPRKVKIYNLNLLDFNEDAQEGKIEAEVSKGTYIRTLINDIGEKLEVGATLISLNRTKAMGFDINMSENIEEIEKLKKENKIDNILISVEEALRDLKSLNLNEMMINKIFNGVKIKFDLPGNIYYKVYNEKNIFIGVGYNKEGYFKIKNIV